MGGLSAAALLCGPCVEACCFSKLGASPLQLQFGRAATRLASRRDPKAVGRCNVRQTPARPRRPDRVCCSGLGVKRTGLGLLKPDADQITQHIMPTYDARQRLSGKIILHKLTLELEYSDSMLNQNWSMIFDEPAHPRGWRTLDLFHHLAVSSPISVGDYVL